MLLGASSLTLKRWFEPQYMLIKNLHLFNFQVFLEHAFHTKLLNVDVCIDMQCVSCIHGDDGMCKNSIIKREKVINGILKSGVGHVSPVPSGNYAPTEIKNSDKCVRSTAVQQKFCSEKVYYI